MKLSEIILKELVGKKIKHNEEVVEILDIGGGKYINGKGIATSNFYLEAKGENKIHYIMIDLATELEEV